MLEVYVEVMAATLARQAASETLTTARDELMRAQISRKVSFQRRSGVSLPLQEGIVVCCFFVGTAVYFMSLFPSFLLSFLLYFLLYFLPSILLPPVMNLLRHARTEIGKWQVVFVWDGGENWVC